MYANRCHTCLKVLEWTKWATKVDGDMAKKLDEHGYTRSCCRRMMITSIDPSEDMLGLINVQKSLLLQDKAIFRKAQEVFHDLFHTPLPLDPARPDAPSTPVLPPVELVPNFRFYET